MRSLTGFIIVDTLFFGKSVFAMITPQKYSAAAQKSEPKLWVQIYVFATFFQSLDALNFGHEFERQFASTPQ